MDSTHIPEYIDDPITIDANDHCNIITQLINQNERFYAQFNAINNLTKYDKLCIYENKLCIQKLSPWRYFVRKYRNQNSSTLAVYLKNKIVEYENFIYEVCRECNDHPKSLELHKVAATQYDFIQNALIIMKYMRDKYNVRTNSKDISVALEMWYLKLTKIKPALLHIISNKRFNSFQL